MASAIPATVANWPKWAQAVFTAWPFANAVSNGTVSTRGGLYVALYLALQGMPWAQAVPAGMLAAGQAVCAHIQHGGAAALRYASAGYMQRACGTHPQPPTAAQLAALTPTQVATALRTYANFTASTANYNGIAAAAANGSRNSATPVYAAMLQPANGGVATYAVNGAPAVTTGWQGATAAQPPKGYSAPTLPKVVAPALPK